MTEHNDDRRKKGLNEMHFQTVVQAIVLGVLLWVGDTLVELKDGAAKQAEKMTSIEEKVGDLKQQVSTINARFDNYPTRTELDSRFQVEGSKHLEIDRRLETLEGKRAYR